MEKMIGKVQKLLISESPLLLNHSAMLSMLAMRTMLTIMKMLTRLTMMTMLTMLTIVEYTGGGGDKY